MIPIGIGSFVTALTALFGPAVEKRVKGVLNIMRRFQHVKNHVIVCGYSNVAESAIDELQEKDVPYVIVDDRDDVVLQLRSKGHDVLAGDPTQRETLEQANVCDAVAVIAAFDSDSVNILIALTAKELRESDSVCKFRILVRVEDEENVEKAKRIGADEVISPSTMGGRLLAGKAAEMSSG
jgi:voltage-gated potassium channel